MKLGRIALLAVAGSCVLLGGCISNAIRVFDPARKVPYQLYTGSQLPPEKTTSLLLLSETDERGSTTKGWVRVLSVDGVDVSNVPNTWARITPGSHHLQLICRAGALHSGFKERTSEWDGTFDANTTYFWQISLVMNRNVPGWCEPAGMMTAGLDKGHIALIPGL